MMNAASLWSNAYVGDLFWWRVEGDIQTNVTILWSDYGYEEVTFTFVLFTPQGEVHASWEQTVAPWDIVRVDSQEVYAQATIDASLTDGVLGIFVTIPGEPSELIKENFYRLYGIVNWYSTTGELVSLHSDQVALLETGRGPREINFTEIVVQETPASQNYLVLLNGDRHQPAGVLELSARNHRGETIQAVYQQDMLPYSRHKLYLADIFDDLIAFCDSAFITIEGHFNSQGTFTRP